MRKQSGNWRAALRDGGFLLPTANLFALQAGNFTPHVISI
jgi:hypothetical protein